MAADPSPQPPGSASMQEPSAVRGMFASIARRYDLANHLLSAGLDYFWRRRIARMVQAWKPERILDLATGSGDVALVLKRACPGACIIGADFCAPMLEQARRKGLTNLVVGDGTQLPFASESFDVVTVAFGLRNMASYPGALREMRRVLRPGGHLVVLDFSLPQPPLLGLYRWYLHYILPRIAGALTGDRGAYQYLGASIEQFPKGNDMVALIAQCGFASAKCEPLSTGIVSLYTGVAV